jgi:hypothetical protein
MKESKMKKVYVIYSLGLLLAIALFIVVAVNQPNLASATGSNNFDYEKAADVHAARWVAMAHGYEQMGLLNFDYERSADIEAARWTAMAHGYEQMGLLNFDYEQAADNQAARWVAMAKAYERMGMLTR